MFDFSSISSDVKSIAHDCTNQIIKDKIYGASQVTKKTFQNFFFHINISILIRSVSG